MSKADELLKKWVEHCGYYDEYDDECWTDSDGREYNKEYTALMKDTIKYVENLNKKET